MQIWQEIRLYIHAWLSSLFSQFSKFSKLLDKCSFRTQRFKCSNRQQFLFRVRLTISNTHYDMTNYLQKNVFMNLIGLFCPQDGKRLFIGAAGSWYWQGKQPFFHHFSQSSSKLLLPYSRYFFSLFPVNK